MQMERKTPEEAELRKDKKVVVDVGKKEFSSGLTLYVTCSRVCYLKDFLFKAPFSYERLFNFVHIPLSIPLTLLYQTRPTMLLASA